MSTNTTPDVYVESDHALPLVQMSISLRTGAALDPEGREGLTRLMGRLMRRTGGGLDSNEIENRLDTLGSALGIDATQSTLSFSGTVIRRSLGSFWDLVEQVVAKPSFEANEFNRLRRETEGEIVDARDSDRSIVRRWFRRRLFEGHPYGRSVSGWLRTIAAVEHADVETQWKRMLTRGNVVFGFAGDIAPDEANDLAQRLNSLLPEGGAGDNSVAEPSPVRGRNLLIIDKPARTQTQILIGSLGSHPDDSDHIPLHVANTAFGGTFTARLTQEVRAKRGWSYGAYSSLPYGRRRSSFSMWTFPKAEDAAPCIAMQLEMLEKWRDDGLTQEELDRAKNFLVGSHAFAIDTAGKRVALKLDAELYKLPEGYFEAYVENVKRVTLEDANAAVRNRLSADDLLVAVVGTEADIGPAVREAIPNLNRSEVIPFDSE